MTAPTWAHAAFMLMLGVVWTAASIAGGRADLVPGTILVFLLLAAVLAFGGRSETIRMLRGEGADERWMSINLRAIAFTGIAVALTVVVGALYEIGTTGRVGEFAPVGWSAAALTSSPSSTSDPRREVAGPDRSARRKERPSPRYVRRARRRTSSKARG